MKAIHDAVQKELELHQILKDAIREKEVGLRELQKVLLSALYIVNQLLDEQPAGAVSAQEEAAEAGISGSMPLEAHVGATRASRHDVGHRDSAEVPNTDTSPRDLP